MSLGKVSIAVEAQIAKFESDIGRAARLLEKETGRMQREAQKNLRAVGTSVLGFAAAFVSARTLVQGFFTAVDQADKLNDFTIRLGLSAQAVSGYGYAATQTGTDLDGLGIGFKKLTKNIADAVDTKSEMSKLFAALDIDPVDRATGKLVALEKIIPQIADRFKALDDPITEAALAQQLFGKSGADLIEFLNLGSQGLGDMQAKARALGIELGQDTLSAADQFNDTVGDLKTATQGFYTQLSSELLPELTKLAQWAIEFVSDGDNAKQIAKDLGDVTRFLAGVMRDAGDAANWFKETLDFGSLGDNAKSQLQGLVDFTKGTINAFGGAADEIAAIAEGNRGAQLAAQRRQKDGQEQARAGLWGDTYVDPKAKADFSDVRGSVSTTATSAAEQAAAAETKKYQDRIAALMRGSGGGSGKKSAGKSDEERDAERLAKQYEGLVAQQRERIALFGKESEEARVRYQIETDDLSKLDAATQGRIKTQQALAVENAKWIDSLEELAEIEQAWADSAAANTERITQRNEAVSRMLTDLEDEIRLLGLSSEAQEIYNNLKWAGVDAATAEGQAIAEATKRKQDAERARAAMDGLANATRGLFEGILDYTKGGREAFRDFVDDIRNLAIQLLADAALRKLGEYLKGLGGAAGGGAGGGSSGGWSGFLSMLGSAFGGGRASGGPTQRGMFYEVNEQGPELYSSGGRTWLMAGERDGRVTPAASQARGGDGGPGTVLAVFGEQQLQELLVKFAKSPTNERITVTHFRQNKKGL